jgi:hypothetical protein
MHECEKNLNSTLLSRELITHACLGKSIHARTEEIHPHALVLLVFSSNQYIHVSIGTSYWTCTKSSKFKTRD